MNLLDKAIGYISPKAALQRAADRARLEMLHNVVAGYGGDRRDRSNQGWNPAMASGDKAILPGFSLRLSRARDLCQTTAHGASSRRAFRRKVVGIGISPVPTVRLGEGEHREWNNRILELFNAWAKSKDAVDVEGSKTFWDIQRLIAGEMFEAGEAIIVKSYKRRRDGLPGLTLQCFEPEQFDTTITRHENNQVRHGIEVDANGRKVAYHFLANHPSDVSGAFPHADRNTIRIPASRVYHVYEVERVRQTHGVTRLAPGMGRLKGMEAYDEATLLKKRMEACIGIVASKDADDTGTAPGLVPPSGEDGLDDDGNEEVNFQPGMLFRGKPGETLSAFAPAAAATESEVYTTNQIRAVGALTGMGYGEISMDFTKGTYSGQRQELLAVNAEGDICEQIIDNSFNELLWIDFVTTCVLEGLIESPGFFASPLPWLRVEWNGTPRPWIDPKNEVDAVEKELILGLTTRKRELNQKGYNVRDTFEQIAEEEALASQLEINVSPNRGGDGSKPAGQQSAPKQPAPEEESTE